MRRGIVMVLHVALLSVLVVPSSLCLGSVAHAEQLPVDGEAVDRVVREGESVTLPYELLGNMPVRISIGSDDVDFSRRLLIAVRHGDRIISWALPYVEAGYAYSQVQRTLCPEVSSRQLFIDVSSHYSMTVPTDASRNLTFTISVSYVSDFELSLNQPLSVRVSPPSSAVYSFNFDSSNLDHVLIKVTSHNEGSTVCSITSVQSSLCPVDQIIDNPDHRGIFQTMLQLSAINTRRPDVGDKVHVVLSVIPTDSECSDSNRNLIDGLVTVNRSANYYPVFNDSITDERIKNITITVEKALPATKYWIAAVVLVLIYAVFYILSVLWILLSDYILFRHNPAHELIQEINTELQNQGQGDTDGGEEEVDGELEKVTDNKQKKSRRRRRRRRRRTSQAGVGGRLVQRPSLWSVISGLQWSEELVKMTPACSNEQNVTENDIAARFKQALLQNQLAMSTSPTIPPAYCTTQSLPAGGIVSFHAIPVDRSSSDPNSSNPVTVSLQPTSVRRMVSSHQSFDGAEEKDAASAKANRDRGHRRMNSYDQAVSMDTITEHSSSSPVRDDTPPPHVPDPHDTETEAESPQEHHSLTNNKNLTLDKLTPGRPDGVSLPPKLLQELRLPKKLSELSFAEGKDFQRKYRGHWVFVTVITLFYAIPAFQLMLTYQQFLNRSGNEDLCYYNTLCGHPLGILSSFNHIWSNIGFVSLGALFITVAYRRRQSYRFYEAVNEGFVSIGREKVGVPQHFGIYYAIGMALIGEGVLSAAYHICPSSSNYQFDTTMLFVLVALGLYKLYECRNPDNVPHTHWLLLTMSLLILLIGVGVIYPANVGFYVVFFIVFECAVIVFTVENYYRWKLKLWQFRNFKVFVPELKWILRNPWPPQNRGKFVFAVVAIVVNFILGLLCVAIRPEDFATVFLYIMILNLVMSLCYYGIMKLCLKEYKHKKITVYSLVPLVLFVISLPFWVIGITMYALSVTNWLHSPATSRNLNAPCVFLEFYDTHDLWHCFTAFALFFSLLMLMTLDDNQEYIKRSELKLF